VGTEFPHLFALVTLLEDLDFSFQLLRIADCKKSMSFLRVRASAQYLVLDFAFNLNQGCSGVRTCGNGVPHTFF